MWPYILSRVRNVASSRSLSHYQLCIPWSLSYCVRKYRIIAFVFFRCFSVELWSNKNGWLLIGGGSGCAVVLSFSFVITRCPAVADDTTVCFPFDDDSLLFSKYYGWPTVSDMSTAGEHVSCFVHDFMARRVEIIRPIPFVALIS